MNGKKGFTLVELLAVIVILAIILAIAIPGISGIIKSATKGSFGSDAKLVLQAVEYKKLKDSTFDSLTITKDNMQEKIGLSGDKYAQVSFSIVNSKVKVILVGADKFDGLTAYGTFDNMNVVNSEDYDEVPPVITILGDNPTYVGKGLVYTDAGATATDLKDGNITISSTIIKNASNEVVECVDTASFGTFTITYTAIDSQGNSVSSIRVVNVADKTPPVITILGDNPVSMKVGGIYNDAGATALDDADGDITTSIVATGTVNPSVIGTYTINYNVSDGAGNTANQVTRTINVEGEYSALKGVNRPNLAPGMTPIKWDGSTLVTTTTSDTDWYNYTTIDKKWANAQTADGSMWVWIPRYVYKITSGWHSWNTGTIDIQFSMDIDDTKGGTVTLDTGTTSSASNNKWTNHPAFTFGATELTGIWVAKFEASGTTGAVSFVPNATSLRTVTIGDMFTATRNMETNTIYGWETSGTNLDTHMMKNIEWGAATYLAKSVYGKNAEISVNNNSSYTTGCSGSEAYNTANGQQTSTTGNIYGIYDMSGGSYEYVAAYINNGNASLATYGSSIINGNSKYRDIYTSTSDSDITNYSNASLKKGDAVYETSSDYSSYNSWYADQSYTPYGSYAWFVRGGLYGGGTQSGSFNFFRYPGYAINNTSFRSILVVGVGL